MAKGLESLLNILELVSLERDLFRGACPNNGFARVFGGQVISQALIAAQQTIDDTKMAHSLHGYFTRPTVPGEPIIYQVDRDRDGRSFARRRVIAKQYDKEIFSMTASFHIPETGMEHNIKMPDVPHPEDLPNEEEQVKKYIDQAPEIVRQYWQSERTFELRTIDITHYVSDEKLEPRQHIWFRAKGKIPDNQTIQQAVLAYASDMSLLDTSLFAHGRAAFDPALQMASLDHAIWFHRPINMENWHLYAQDSPSSSGARGLSRGSFFTKDGEVVASVAQEGLIRLLPSND